MFRMYIRKMTRHNQWKSQHSEHQRNWRVLRVGALSPSAGVLGNLRKCSGSNKHLGWVKIDLNATEIIYRVKVKSQAGNI